jgi:hypothetical protein
MGNYEERAFQQFAKNLSSKSKFTSICFGTLYLEFFAAHVRATKIAVLCTFN